MLIKEYRVTLPLTVEEVSLLANYLLMSNYHATCQYQIGQLFSVAEASKNETGGGEGVQVIKNEPFQDYPLLGGKFSKGQYTYKIYHLQSKVPTIVKMIAPKGSLEIHEEAWNAYPYCKTILTNPDYMKNGFVICIESMHCPDAGHQENVHELSPDKLAKREVVRIDIANDRVSASDYKEATDPGRYKSLKTNRGPLTGNWIKTSDPAMTCYKLVTCEFKWLGLQGKVESFIQKSERRLFTNFHRELFCWIDRWHGMTIQDIRDIEEKTRKELDELRQRSGIRGTRGDDQ